MGAALQMELDQSLETLPVDLAVLERRHQRDHGTAKHEKLSWQAAEKDSYASLRFKRLAPTYSPCTPPLVDFSRASPLSLFEQPARRIVLFDWKFGTKYFQLRPFDFAPSAGNRKSKI
jgi:hypothetical protein